MQHIDDDKIAFFNHDDKQFTCAEIPEKSNDVGKCFNWKKIKQSKYQGCTTVELFIKIRIVYYDFWQKVKAPMLNWLKMSRVFMKPCRGRKPEELVKIGFLGDGIPLMNQEHLADRMKAQIQAALSDQNESWLSECHADRTTPCFLEITLEKVVISFKNLSIEIQGLVVLCPKNLIDLHVGLMDQALKFSQPTKDLTDLQFVPFKYKNSKVVKDGKLTFAKMIQKTKSKIEDTVVSRYHRAMPNNHPS